MLEYWIANKFIDIALTVYLLLLILVMTPSTTSVPMAIFVTVLLVVALIYLSYVKKKMQDTELFDKWTLQGLLDELGVIELFEHPDHGRVLGEVTQKQEQLYTALGIKLPSL